MWISEEDAEKKQDVPTVEKKVWNKTSSAWQDTTFAGVNGLNGEDDLVFKITGTLPSNLNDKKKDSEGNETSEDVYSSYTDYKFTDTYEAGITPTQENSGNLTDLKVYLYNSSDSNLAAGMTGQEAGENAINITGLFDVSHDATNRKIEVNLKKSGVTDKDGNTGAVDLKKTYKMKNGSVSTDDDATEVSFAPTSKIVVRFTAKLNSSAVAGALGNANKATLEFRNAKGEYLTEYTPPDTVRVFTFKLKVTKYKDSVADGNELENATFNLYKGSKSEANKVATGTSDSNGVINFTSLTTIATGTYILEETNSPLEGYNRMTDVTISITGTTEDPSVDPKLTGVSVTTTGSDASFTYDDVTATITGTVVNKAGSLLPTTGGPGTTIFYIIGGILIAGALVVLVRRRRRA